MRKIAISSVVFLGILIISLYSLRQFFYQQNQSGEVVKSVNTFFATLPLVDRTDKRFSTPCIAIRIGDITVKSKIDLGFVGELSASKEILNQIKEKTFLGMQKMHGFKGKQYELKVYSIPEFQIGKMTFHEPSIQEESEDFHHNSSIITDRNNPSIPEAGRIGWQSFANMGLFLDLANKKAAICNGLSSLKKEGYAVELFTRTALSTKRGFLEINVEIANKQLQCVLDTGASLSILNIPVLKNGSKYEIDSFEDVEEFMITDNNFGPLCFYHLPIELPIHVDAILGMDFFLNNMVFLDFKNNMVYIAPSLEAQHPKQTVNEN